MRQASHDSIGTLSGPLASTIFFISVIGIFADRISKSLSLDGRMDFLPEAQLNSNIAFWMPANDSFLFVITFLAGAWAVFLFTCTVQRRSSGFFAAFVLFLFGAASNLFDRLRYGGVIDWIAIPGFTVFNIADILILSSALFAVMSLRRV